MYLKRLELQGFKSFADRTVLEFKPGITAVIGPNGSGKSNISDAIRWVLGEQSMKSLRGAKSEDIIFAGTQSRKSLGFAEVSMVIDNEDGGLPIEYSEVTVTRKLYRTGESGYFINKVPCRLKDVLELFMDTGIGKDGYSIIGQGKVDEILSNKSEDRRHIFEEAAGIVKYRARRKESEKKLEQTKINLIRINDILAEIESNLEPLKLQAEKAKKFLDLREELKNIEIGLFLYKIDTYKEKLEKIKNDKEIFESQLTQENEKLEKMQELKEKLKQEIDNLTEEIENSLKIKDGSLEGTIKNNLDYDIKKLIIVSGQSVWDLGEVSTGEQISISEAEIKNSYGIQGYADSIQNEYYNAQWDDSVDKRDPKFKNVERYSSLLYLLSNGNYIGAKTKIIAITDLPVDYSLKIENKSISNYDLTAVVQDADIDFKDEDGNLNFPEGYFEYNIASIADTANFDYYEGYIYGYGDVILEYDIDTNVDVKEITINSGTDRWGYQYGVDGEYYIYNYNTNEYEKFSLSSGSYKISNDGSYTLNNKIQIKIVASNDGNNAAPKLMIKGVEK